MYADRRTREFLAAVHEKSSAGIPEPHPSQMSRPSTSAAEPKSPEAKLPIAGSTINEHKMNAWLDGARSEQMLPNSIFLKDVIVLTTGDGQEIRRFPFETSELVTSNIGAVPVTVSVHSETCIVWSAMLYGTGERLMTHLNNALVLGYQLRHKLKPALEKLNLTFQNLLYITTSALEEDSFRAVSFLWSIKFVSLPVVDKDRLESTSQHLIGENTEAGHVFLKCEAFKLLSVQLSIISDLDILVLDAAHLARYLAQFVRGGILENDLQPGEVAVLQRRMSRISDGMTMDRPPNRPRGEKPVPLSYCFCMVKPTQELATLCENTMRSRSTTSSGKLSDQDLLVEVAEGRWKLIHHGGVMFPSWWSHTDVAPLRASEIWQLWKKQTSIELAKEILQTTGAVHLSAAFGLT